MDRLQRNSEIAQLVVEVKNWWNRYKATVCICKGVEQGLIDFPCLLGAEVVFLCWQLGEPTVSHWHRIEDGFAGAGPCSMSSKRALTEKLLTINRSVKFPFLLLYFCSFRFNRLVGREACDCPE
jgi:hypothetical protein